MFIGNNQKKKKGISYRKETQEGCKGGFNNSSDCSEENVKLLTGCRNEISPEKKVNIEGIEIDIDTNAEENYAISKVMDAVKDLSNETILHPHITFLDFTGKNMFYDFLQINLSPKTFYILVVDMTKSLNEMVDVPESNEMHCSRFESWTYGGINFITSCLNFRP